ncbi:GAF domain-containing protein [Dermatophilaceae bacterium Soc4.6]
MTDTSGDPSPAVAVTSEGPDLPVGLGSLLTRTPTAVIAVDHDGCITFVNGPAEQLFQLEAGHVVGHPVEVLVPCLVSARLTGRSSSYLHDLALRRQEAGFNPVGLRGDGTEFPAEVDVTPTDLGDGRVWAVVTVRDVSTRVEAQRQVAELNRAYLALAQLNQAVVRAPDAEALLDSACQVAVEHGGYLGAWVAVPTAEGAVEVLAQAGVLVPYVTQLGLTLDPLDPSSQGPVGVALREGHPVVNSNFLHDATTAFVHERARGYGIASCASLPLRTAGRVVACLTLYADRVTAFDDGVGDLLIQMSNNISFALDGFESARALEAEAAARRDLLLRLVTAEEKERGRIAGDLHDDSVQVLAAVNLRLGLLRRRLGGSPDLADASAMVRTITETVRLASESLRTLLFELEPPLLAQSFTEALSTTAEHVFEGERTTWSVHCTGAVDLPSLERGQILRIVKEALINARKHAHASHVDIDLHRVGGGIEVAVTDDGDGLPDGVDVEHLPRRRGHRGFETMRDRASATGGWCRLERTGTRGATLRFFVPATVRG